MSGLMWWRSSKGDRTVAGAAQDVAPPAPTPPLSDAEPRPMSGATSCASSDCSDAEYLADPGAQQGDEGEPCAACSLERATVRAKAAFFEALIHSTGPHEPAGAQHREPAAEQHTCPLGQQRGGTQGQAGPGPTSAAPPPPPLPPAGASACEAPALRARQAELEALVGSLSQQLAAAQAGRAAAAAALARKAQECGNLTSVVRELAESRSKSVAARAALQDQYLELQAAYARSLRVADLSRTASKENVARSGRAQRTLRDAQAELHAARRAAAAAGERAKRLRAENSALRERVSLLERLDLEEAADSVIKREFSRYRLTETY